VSGAQDWLQGLKENVIIGRLIPARVEIPGMEELLKPQPVPEIAAMSPGGWLGNPDDSDGAPNGSFDSPVEEDAPVEANVFTHSEDAGDSTPEAGLSEVPADDEEDDTPEDAPEDELDAEEDEEEEGDSDLVESGDPSANSASPATGEEDAEGTDEPSDATDGEGDE
jgi:hypothetical protein